MPIKLIFFACCKEYLFPYIPCSFKGIYSFDNNTNDGPLFGYMLNTSVYNGGTI